MSTRDAEFLQKLLAMFRVEAREHLHVISGELTKLGKGDPHRQAEIVETMYRVVHTLKGAARSVNLGDIVSVCQSLENVLSALKNGRISFSPQMSDLLHQVVDLGYALVDGDKPPASERGTIKQVIRRLDGLMEGTEAEEEEIAGALAPEKGEGPETPEFHGMETATVQEYPDLPQQTPAAVLMPAAPETIRISMAALDAVLLRAEEMIAIKLAAEQRISELQDLQNTFETWKRDRQKKRSIGVGPSRSGEGRPAADAAVPGFEARLTALVKAAEDDHRESVALIDMLLDDMKKILMLPFSSMLEMFPLFVRDLARAGGKKVELTMEGGEIEIDRRIMEEMKDPLIHLVRNCLDHGIEMPDERRRKNKSVWGSVKFGIFSRDGKIEIAVSDDGKGLDRAAITSSAVKHGMISQEDADALGEQEALQLVFQSGVTSSPIITDISGRGLGLAIVKEKVEKLNGTISVETARDQGTTFRMVVPLTLATFRGTIVRVAEQLFVLPSIHVERVTRVRNAAVRTVENHETLVFDDSPMSFVRMVDVLGMPSAGGRPQADDSLLQVVVLEAAGKRIAFRVDEIIGEQEVLVKPLGRQLARVRNIMGATVLGNGRVAPIINVADLLKTAVKTAPSSAAVADKMPPKNSCVLVVEDSITARTLLKNILESAGYDVKTAVDGVEAMIALKSREFDIVVSDVEMPRMDGFDLTAKIRSDKKFSELPVVLVTALESRVDRERGIDVGANAYIVKSSFDQSNLLEVIERLI